MKPRFFGDANQVHVKNMKSIFRIAGCGALILALTWGGRAAEPQKAPAFDRQPSPVVFPAGANAVARPSPFSAEISADFIRKVMAASARIEEAKRRITERQAQLYVTNPEIKACRELMVKLQKEINSVLDADQELAELKMNRDIIWSTMPALPKARNPVLFPQMPSGAGGPVITGGPVNTGNF